MAIKVERTLVCDFGEQHTGKVLTYRITVEGRSTSLDLCPRCAKPIITILDKAGKEPTETGRMRIFSMEEIEARKQKEPPATD